MSRIAVMQPYFFPYIGYFQLINAVDKFVFYDDVDFIKSGWINRNRILINGTPKFFTIPCSDVSSNKSINKVEHMLDERSKKKLLKKIKFTYSNAPNFDRVFSLVNRIFSYETDYIYELAIQSVISTSEYLEMNCLFTKSSDKYDNYNLEATDRLIDICKKEKATDYINFIGGKKLYDKDDFLNEGVNLHFLKPVIEKYQQFGNEFVPWLSIIDVMMFNSPKKIKNDFLNSYSLN